MAKSLMKLLRVTPLLQNWTWLERVLCLVVLSLIIAVFTADVDFSGTWDGEPSLHNRQVQEATNVFVRESYSGGDPARGLLQCFYMFPKMLHDMMLTLFVLALHGVEPVDFATVEVLSAWHSTLWSLVSLAPLYVIIRQYQTRVIALLTLLVAAFSGYILLYANFPRQNMPAHALTWIALSVYLYFRSRSSRLSNGTICTIGLLLGCAVPIHYASTYAFLSLAVSELVLGINDRQIRPAILSIVLLFAAACVVWFTLDILFALYIQKYPDEINWLGQHIKGNSFISGMVYTSNRLYVHAAAEKLERTEWWFLGGFLYRNFGFTGLLLIAIGSVTVLQRLRRQLNEKDPMQTRAILILLVNVLVAVVISLSYFQNARKLMGFYPYWCVLLAIGLYTSSSTVARLIARSGATQPPSYSPWPMVLISLAIVLLHTVLYLPTARATFHARRDTGYMRTYLSRHYIGKILILPNVCDSQLAPTQKNLRELTLAEADQFQYIVLNRLYAGYHGVEFLENIRRVAPVVSYPNQASLPLFWYEFPLKKDYMDFDDPLVCHRNLYRWSEVREYCRHLLKKSS